MQLFEFGSTTHPKIRNKNTTFSAFLVCQKPNLPVAKCKFHIFFIQTYIFFSYFLENNIQAVSYKRYFRCNICFLLLVYTIHLSLCTSLVDPPSMGTIYMKHPLSKASHHITIACVTRSPHITSTIAWVTRCPHITVLENTRI